MTGLDSTPLSQAKQEETTGKTLILILSGEKQKSESASYEEGMPKDEEYKVEAGESVAAQVKETPVKKVDKEKPTLTYALEIIKRFECGNGPKLKAYQDGHGRTIGCGTISYPGERITSEQAYERVEKITTQIVARVNRDYPNVTNNSKAALISLAFNCDQCYVDIKAHGISKERFLSYVYGRVKGKDGKVRVVFLPGLLVRRKAEWELYTAIAQGK